MQRSLRAGKSVFVEKPLCTEIEDLRAIVQAYEDGNAGAALALTVGTNRRFSSMVGATRDHFRGHTVQMHYRVNAAAIPADSWPKDEAQGAGILVAEMCHFVDVFRSICGSPITSVHATGARSDDQ